MQLQLNILRVGLFLTLLFCFHWTPNFLLSFLLSPNDKVLEKTFAKNGFPLVEIPECVNTANAVVVLGGGETAFGTPSTSSMSRLLGAIELLKTSSQKEIWIKNKMPVVFSGGVTGSIKGLSEAKILFQFTYYLYGKDLDQFKIILENKSKNTHENAYYTKAILNQIGDFKNIILITNSFHRLRAQKTFEAQGFHVCPVSVPSAALLGGGYFQFRNGEKTAVILHEYLGLIAYYFAGWL